MDLRHFTEGWNGMAGVVMDEELEEAVKDVEELSFYAARQITLTLEVCHPFPLLFYFLLLVRGVIFGGN